MARRRRIRKVFKFRLIAVEGEEDFAVRPHSNIQPWQMIPSSVKLAVWIRNGGKCTMCGATDELHFDHDLPWSKGGTSSTEEKAERLLPKKMFNFFALGTISKSAIESYELLTSMCSRSAGSGPRTADLRRWNVVT
jgi:hypothetical protein